MVLGLALISAGGAAIIVRNAARAPVPSAAKPDVAMAQVLVASRAIAAGQTVELKDLRWQPWPLAAVPKGGIHAMANSETPAFTPTPARYPIAEGEPISEAKLSRPGDGGVMATLIAPGKRAVAVPVRDESAAGGFIQPQDKVDVLWTQRAGESGAGAAKPGARTLLRGAKVLAIGKALGARDRAAAEVHTATLELTPEEARIIADARAAGEISLALIPAGDIAATAMAEETATVPANPRRPAVQIVKFGRQSAPRREQ